MPLDPQLKDMLDFIAAVGHPPMEQGTPEDGRKAMRAMSVDLVRPEDVVSVGSVSSLRVPGGAGEREARLYKPEGEGPWDTLVFLHGGGFVVGDLDTHDQTCRRLPRRRARGAERRLPAGPRGPVPGRAGRRVDGDRVGGGPPR